MSTINDIINLGFSYHQSGKFTEAELAYNEALNLDSENAEVHNLLSVLKLQQNETDDAIMLAERAIQLNPCEYYYETLFQAYIRAGAYNKIIAFKDIILSKYSKNFSLFFNLALAYKNFNDFTSAIEFYERALKIDPTSYQGWFNLAHLYEIEGQGKNSVSAMKVCTKLKPKDAETEYFYAISLMRAKNYSKGLKFFENRLCKETAVASYEKSYPNLASRKKMWKGENIKNKTLFVYYEAGYGDVIMFSRYLPLARKKCKKLIFAPQKPLVPLFEQSNLGIDELVEGYIPEKDMQFDVHAPLLSLPFLLGLKEKNIFETPEGYLNADMQMAEDYQRKFFNNDKLKIGIKWQGNTYYDKDRVLPVEKFDELISLEGTQFYSFQTFEGAESIDRLENKSKIINIGDEFLNFSQTASAMMNLDLVICNDTSLAHLAGALGIPCFIMLPYETNWRWHDDMSHCDWYDSVKLFRKNSPDSWDELFNRVKAELVKGIEKKEIMKQIISEPVAILS